MKKMSVRIFYSVFILIAFSTSCLPSSILRRPLPTQTSYPPVWIQNWLKKPKCSPPCWEGIRPGVSDARDVERLTDQFPDMSVQYQQDTSTVQMIKLNLAINAYLPISEVTSKYGEPQYLRIFKCDPNSRCEVHLIYDDLGMLLNLYPQNLGDFSNPSVEITPSSGLSNINFMEIGINKYFSVAEYHGAIQDLILWTGYGRYP